MFGSTFRRRIGQGFPHLSKPIAGLNLRVSAQPTTSRIYRVKDSVHFPHVSDSCWHGYVGTWHVDLHDPAAAHTVTGLRTLRWRDATHSILDQTNVYGIARAGTTVRQADGLHQKDFVYQGALFEAERQEDPVLMTRGSLLVLDECASASLGSFRLPAVALTSTDGGGAPGGAAEEAGDVAKAILPAAASAGLLWGLELFLKDHDCRWGLVLMYDTPSGRLSKITFVQEYDTTADPHTPHVLDSPACAGAVRPARPPLRAGDGAGWVTRGSVGRRVARLRPEPSAPAPASANASASAGDVATALAARGAAVQDGQVLQDETSRHQEQRQQLLVVEVGLHEDVVWEPPPGASSSPAEAADRGELLMPLPDAMYLRAPASLADLGRSLRAGDRGGGGGAGGGGDGDGRRAPHVTECVFEFGGHLRYPVAPGAGGVGGGEEAGGRRSPSWPGLQRLVVRYDAASGRFLGAARDVFAPAESLP